MTFKKTKQEWFDGAWERSADPRPGIEHDGGGIQAKYSSNPGCFIGCQVPPALALAMDLNAHDVHLQSPAEWGPALRDVAEKWRLPIPGEAVDFIAEHFVIHHIGDTGK